MNLERLKSLIVTEYRTLSLNESAYIRHTKSSKKSDQLQSRATSNFMTYTNHLIDDFDV